MEQISSGTSTVYLDYMITGAANEPLIVSYFDRSSQNVRAFGASIMTEGVLVYNKRTCHCGTEFDVSYSVIQKSKEKFTQGMAIKKDLREKYLITRTNDIYKDLYNQLMSFYNLPLLEWWMPEVLKEMVSKRYLYKAVSKPQLYGNKDRTIVRNGEKVPIKELLVYNLSMSEENLKKMITELFHRKKIWITKRPQRALVFENVDEYFQVYGMSIVENLKEILNPVSSLNPVMENAAMHTKRLFPQQITMCNGVGEYLKKTKNRYALLCMETGTGKTLISAVMAEMMYVEKWLRAHPGKTLKDAYEKDGIINYRHIIMCPGHLVKKWRKELKKEIPYAKPVIIESLSQLAKLKAEGTERKNGKEWYIMSKDFTKLSYQRIPTPSVESSRNVEFFKCADCGIVQHCKTEKCIGCNSTNIVTFKTNYKRKGLICPHCGRLLYPTNYKFDAEIFENSDNFAASLPMQWYDMSSERANNQNCIYCGEELWMPFVKNINTDFFAESREPKWFRQTFWANRAKKGKVTNWVLRGKEQDAATIYGEVLNSMEDSVGGCRKYAPALYIKKHMKGYFDIFICDEVHKSKGGSTAQGNAFHQIMKSAKYTLGLTGTIAGGMATDLYYLLYRLEPARMKAKGYNWGSVMKFAEEYGCIQTDYVAEQNLKRNVCSRGRQLGRPKVMPGISPLIFSDFLLDRAVFLNIGDMSEHMPPLYEYVKLCRPETEIEIEMHRNYNEVIKELKEYEKCLQVNLSSVRNQFAMSYLDKPYGVEPIVDPNSGNIIVEPMDYGIYKDVNNLLAKERLLIDTVRKELSEGRNCVIYPEYTQSESTNVLPRLKEIIMEHCKLSEEEVVVMKANYPSSSAREEWMHEQATYGMKVMICNPRLCETGLDFCWEESGIIYNYPTLIFYQAGYSLFVMWQAAGRAWRLNQRVECRTYYLACEMTVQQAILQVLGEKKAATAAIQGKFSADGLASMARGVNTKVRIAQIMSEMDMYTENSLQKMFDVITNDSDSMYGDGQFMKLFKELVVGIEQIKQTEQIVNSVFDMFRLMSAGSKQNSVKRVNNSFVFMMPQNNTKVKTHFIEPEEKTDKKPVKRKSKRAILDECCSLFD